ncbi:MAG: glycosyltransferase family 39 protein, partial [Phycisphaerales bacterium]|nr:glycosyltransferase family 39 protein [Phycisphaerales bacterium]
INGGDARVTPTESRAPSIVAGVTAVICIYFIGGLLFGGFEAWLGALLLIGSMGYLGYTHSARPDMLYNASAALAVLGIVMRLKERSPRIGAALIIAGVLLAGATKGPWVPLALLASGVVALRRWGTPGLTRRVMMPWTFLICIALPFLAWYGLMLVMVQGPTTSSSWTDELGTRVDFSDGIAWFEPYYPIRLFVFMAPWWFLYPVALLIPVWKRLRQDRELMFLWILMIGNVIAWQILPGRRPHYTLLAVMLLCPLMATLARRAFELRHARVPLVVQAATLAAGGVAGAILLDSPILRIASIGVVAAGAALAVVALRPPLRPSFQWAGLGLTSVVLAMVAGRSGSVWSAERAEVRSFALAVVAQVPADRPLVAWRGSWDNLAFYGDRNIPRIRSLKDIHAEASESGGLYVLSDRALKDLDGLESTLLLSGAEMSFESETRDARLYLVTAVPATGDPTQPAPTETGASAASRSSNPDIELARMTESGSGSSN